MHDAPVISIAALTKRFGDDVVAVDDLTFGVDAGQVCGLLGPNGAGKTTTLRVLLGLVRPTSGGVSIFGTPITPSAPVLARVGTIIEQAAFVPYLSGMRNLRLWWEAGGATWPPPGLERALDIAGLGHAIDRKVKTYSLGMNQRLGVARALLGDPEVLVLDEPTVGLDPQEMRSIRRMLKDMGREGVTVLLSSHLLTEVEEVCNYVVVMDRGRLVAAGTVADLTSAGTRTAYLEVDDVDSARRVLSALAGVRSVSDAPPGLAVDLDGVDRAQVVAALVHAGIGVETVMQRHRLEDAFVGLVGEETTRQ
ncbi:MAG TPA: ABC transporter ATP-binding protein [Acidimicrobiia bacterium]|nr:ABC transporter ATP-binding protein [Acidimicrobiia bacterium]